MAMKVVYTNFGGMLVHENRGGVETEYVADTLGSVMMCRSATGATTYTADYWPYGEVASSTGTNPSAWGFGGTLGYYTDSVPGSLYVRARIYLPSIGRWATVDPLWPDETPYGYGGFAPQRLVDPQGLSEMIMPPIWATQPSCQDAINCITNAFMWPPLTGGGYVRNPCPCHPGNGGSPGHADFALALCMLKAESGNWDPDHAVDDNGGGLGQLTPPATKQLCTWGCNLGITTPSDARGANWCNGAIAAIYFLDCVGLKRYGGHDYTPLLLKRITTCAACVRNAKDDPARCKCTAGVYKK
jgi:RHS repeat-associated protein